MNEKIDSLRRRLLVNVAMGAVMVPIAAFPFGAARAAAPLLSPDDPTAKSLEYVEDASKSTSVKKGSHCGSCALYQGAAGSTQGACAIFAGKEVKAAGVCDSWAPKA